MKRILLLSLASAACVLAEARDWTSADGTRTFNGEATAYNKVTETVTMSVDGQVVEFTTDKLSEEDRKFLSTWNPTKANQTKSIAQLLSVDKLVRLKEKEFAEAKVEKEPKYFLLCYSASW